MRRNQWVFALVIPAVFVMAEAALAQSTQFAQSGAPSTMQRQRAPGVPMAPQTGIGERQGGERMSREEPARQVQKADRDIPMPRPVPSIIAP